MKHKPANHPGWKRILQNRFYHTYLADPDYTGHISLYCMDAVRAPLVVHFFNRPTTIVDDGYAWLQQYPAGEAFTVTTHFNAAGQTVGWYIDMVLRTGVDADGIPWMDDLYLDLVVSPTFEVTLKDADELLAARQSGEITRAEFDLAWRTAEQLMAQIARRQLGPLGLSAAHRQRLLGQAAFGG